MSKKTFVPLSNEFLTNNSFSRLLTTTTVLSAALMPSLADAAEEKPKQMQTITVIESQSNDKYNSKQSTNSKITTPLLDTPRTITTVTRQLMDDQGVTKVSDALRNVPGVSLAAGEGGNQGDNLTIRGFSARNDFFIDGMRDFGSYFRDAFNLEAVEVIQGPSSSLVGRGSVGGSIQQNSKQAFLGTLNNASVMLGTNNTRRFAVDVNRKIDGMEGAAFRLNAMSHDNDVAGRDQAQYKRRGFAPTLAFGLGTDTRLNLSYLYQEEDNRPDYGIPFFAGKPADVDRNSFYGLKSDHLRTNVNIATAKFEHDFSKNLTLRNQTRYARYYRDVQATEPQMTTSPTTVTRSMKTRQQVETYIGNQTDLTSKFETAGVKHTLVTGLAIESETSAPTVFAFDSSSSTNTAPSTSLLNPNPYAGLPSSRVSSAGKGQIDTVGVYGFDSIKFNPKWELSLGTRFDSIRTSFVQGATSNVGAVTNLNLGRVDNVVSYNAGLVYKPKENGSIYVTHGTSFNPSAESISLTSATSNLKPEKTTIYEVGTKWDLFKKRLSTAFSVFYLEKQNARETLAGGVNALSGNQRAQGFQAQASGSITDKWKVMAGYAYTDSWVAKSAIDPNYNGRTLANTPTHSFNLFTTYQLPHHVEVGGGANYVSQRFAATTGALDAVSRNVRHYPGYLLFNLMTKYPLTKSVNLQLNLNNLTNEYYYDQARGNNAVVPGEGRVLLLTTNIKF